MLERIKRRKLYKRDTIREFLKIVKLDIQKHGENVIHQEFKSMNLNLKDLNILLIQEKFKEELEKMKEYMVINFQNKQEKLKEKEEKLKENMNLNFLNLKILVKINSVKNGNHVMMN